MKNKIFVFIFILYVSIFSILNIIIPDNDISKVERRKLKKFPNFELESEWINDVDSYLLDHFVLRHKFRSLKANYNYNILNKLDNNGIYINNNYIFKSNYPTNKKSIDNFKNKINKLSDLFSENNNVFIMAIPDKNYYLNSNDFLHIDYDYIYNEINELEYINIDVRDILKLEDYYQTDTHWRQEKLDKVVKKMSTIMNFSYEETLYQENKYNNFYGVYYGERATKRTPEQLIYLTSDLFENITVNYLENKNLNEVYNETKLTGLDSYDVYLDGASSFIEINNQNALNDKELVVFRDSFGSSLIPLLIKYYSKITIIDNRYINSDNFKDKIVFKNQDVLFMCSTLIINDSGSLKG